MADSALSDQVDKLTEAIIELGQKYRDVDRRLSSLAAYIRDVQGEIRRK